MPHEGCVSNDGILFAVFGGVFVAIVGIIGPWGLFAQRMPCLFRGSQLGFALA